MAECAVKSCKNKSGKDLAEGVTFHPFPRDPIVKQVWVSATGNLPTWKPDHHQICSEHFEKNCFQQLKKGPKLFIWAIPTLKIMTPGSAAAKESSKKAVVEQPKEPEKPDGETPEVNEEIEKRKKLDKIFVKPLCSRCKRRAALNVSSNMLEGQAKSIVSKVYHFLAEEYRDIEDKYGDTLDLTPLSKFRERTAFACGVSYRAVGLVLKEEQEWMEARGLKVDEPPMKKRKESKEVESPSTSTSEEEITEEENCEAHDKTPEMETEVEIGNTEESELLEETVQEEPINQDNMDVNENYANNEIESVPVQFEFHNIENTNQSEEIPQPIIPQVEPIMPIINQLTEQLPPPPVQPIIPQNNLTRVCIDPNLLAMINSLNQSRGEMPLSIKPRMIRLTDPNISEIEKQAKLCAMEPAVVTAIGQPKLIQELNGPRYGVNRQLVARKAPKFQDTCTNICCREKSRATITYIRDPNYVEGGEEEHSDDPNGSNEIENEEENEIENDEDIEVDDDFNEIENEEDEALEEEEEEEMENGEEEGFEEDEQNEIEDGMEYEEESWVENEDENGVENGEEGGVENGGENEVDTEHPEKKPGHDDILDFADTGCQTERDTDTPLIIAAGAQVYCDVDLAMNALGYEPASLSPQEAQAIVADPRFLAGHADGENMMHVQRLDYADGLGYYVILK